VKSGYHHGNLRQALVEAVLTLIPEQGPRGFTLSEAAKTAGVTPAAVYRHFAGRDQLLAEVARQGYDIFAALMEFAYDEGRPSSLAALEATGRAYLAFARKYPGHYMAMFESGLVFADHPELAKVAYKAKSVLDRASEGVLAQLPTNRRPPASMVSTHIRALSHGIVELVLRPGTAGGPFAADDMLESGIGVYLRGLGLIRADH
jgi:AcrR family transcriptional regulator